MRVTDDRGCLKSLSFGVACHSALEDQNPAYQLPCPLLIQKPRHGVFLFKKDSSGAPRHTQAKRTWKPHSRLWDLKAGTASCPPGNPKASAAPRVGAGFKGQDEPRSMEKSEQDE